MIIRVEDDVEIAITLRHHQQAGFASIIVFMIDKFALPRDLQDLLHRLGYRMAREGAMELAVNSVITATPGLWMYYCFNAEYLFHHFLKHLQLVKCCRSIPRNAAIRRSPAWSIYILMIWTLTLMRCPYIAPTLIDLAITFWCARTSTTTITLKTVNWISSVNYAGAMKNASLMTRRKIDRIVLFKPKNGLKLRENHTFNDEEHYTCACSWHHNLTSAICSFRTAKALKKPGQHIQHLNLQMVQLYCV